MSSLPLSSEEFAAILKKAEKLHETEPIEEAKFLQNVLTQKLSHEQEIICNLQLAYAFLVLSRIKDSEELYYQMLEITRKEDNRELFADALEGVGNVGIDTGNNEEAIKSLQQAISIYQELNLPEKESKASNTLAVLFYQTSDYDEAIQWYNRSLDLTADKKSARYVNALGNSGLIFHTRGDMQKAIEVYETALAISKEKDYHFARMIFQENLGDSYRQLGDFKKAKECFEESIQFAVDHNDEKHVGTIASDFANLWIELGNFEKAFDYLKLALRNLNKVNYPYGLIDAYYVSAKYWLAKGQILDSRLDLETALRIMNENQVFEFNSDVLTLLAEIYESLGNLDKSYDCLMEADNFARKRESEVEHARVLLQRARININLSNYNEAFMFLNEVQWIANKTQNVFLDFDANLLFAQIYLTKYYQDNSNQDHYNKVTLYLTSALDFAKKKQLLPRYLKALVIEGLLHSSQNKHTKANYSLTMAKEIAEKTKMTMKLREIQERLSVTVQSSGSSETSSPRQRFILSIALDDLRKFTSSFIKNTLTEKDVDETFVISYKVHEKMGTIINAVDNIDLEEGQWYNNVMQMGLIFTLNFGQGHKYHKGFFGPFPFGETFLRSIVYTTQLTDQSQGTERGDGKTFVIVSLVFPKKMSPLFYDREKAESIFNLEFGNVTDVTQMNSSFLKQARYNIITKLTADLTKSLEDYRTADLKSS